MSTQWITAKSKDMKVREGHGGMSKGREKGKLGLGLLEIQGKYRKLSKKK